MTFTPFKKTSIAELNAADLALLVDIPEGWFIEYKREPCKSKDYAKEASAFANSRGGWMFIGLEEDPETRKPLGGPGLQTSKASKFLDAARDSIIQNLSPSPYLELIIVSGPIPELLIPNDKCVLVIYIPESQNTPHIHCSGQIYQRQADSSKPINGRAELDDLYKRAENSQIFVDEKLDLGFDNAWRDYNESPWLYLALVPDPALSFHSHDIDLKKFRELLSNRKEISNQPVISLPDIYTSSLGFVARNHREQNDPAGTATTLEYMFDGTFFLSIPLSYGFVSDSSDNSDFLKKQTGKRFITLLQQNGWSNARFIDCTNIMLCMAAMHPHICQLLKEVGACSRYLSRIRMVNIFRSIPFFDSDAYIDSYLNRSIPIILRKEIRIPWRKNKWIELDDISDFSAFLACLPVVLFSLGIGDDKDDINDIITQSIKSFNFSQQKDFGTKK
ncbi:MAG: ATP-binding protein [Thermodesulfovibrionales bacterium]|nr:ATP-binding protein [Thermodesulfovibrionales bacterium]